MAIEKNNFKVSRVETDFSAGSSSDQGSPFASDVDEFDDADSGAGSDDFDLLELGDPGAEFCQVGNQTCCLPFELYDLPDLKDILSLDVWNDCLTEEERFGLTQYLPDMDQHSFIHTLNDLLSGVNFHFGSPITDLFNMLKGGLCEPRVALYRQALNSFQRSEYYHLIKNHHNNMVVSLCMIRDAWKCCRGYSVEEKLRVLNIARTQKNFVREKSDAWAISTAFSEKEDSGGGFLLKNAKGAKRRPGLRYTKENPKGLLKLGSSKPLHVVDTACRAPLLKQKQQVKSNRKGDLYELPVKYSKTKKGRKYDQFKGEIPFTRRCDVPDFTKKLKRSNCLRRPVVDSYASSVNEQTDRGPKNKKRFRDVADEHKLEYEEWNIKPKKSKAERDLDKLNSMSKSNRASLGKTSDRLRPVRYRGVFQEDNVKANSISNADRRKGGRMLLKAVKDEETETDSSDPDEEGGKLSINRKVGAHSLSKFAISPRKIKTGKKQNARNVAYARSFWNSPSREVEDGYLQSLAIGPLEGVNEISQIAASRLRNEVVGEYDDSNQPGMFADCTALSLGRSVDNGDSFFRGKQKSADSLIYSEYDEMEFIPPESSPHKRAKPSGVDKKTFTLITPTVHTGFSFSIIHLFSSVRMAMITLCPEDTEIKNTQSAERHAFTVVDIVNRVKSNPGDPCILETQEPLQDLIRGVLRILSSKTAPLGAKGWKPMVVYEKPTKSWSWVGPYLHGSSEHEEVTSPEAWGVHHKVLVKIVDAFANWLKSGQQTLQQIGSLPPPPECLAQFNLDERERFRDLRAQKSLNTIGTSSEEVRDYFRREEVLRYSVPDRAFTYTAIDGRKSIVAPLRRGGGKPTSKARDHFMLKRDRPPHVTILCLVRDAAARLPGSIGTRADVCTLIRDSQYIVEEVSDAQVNQVVSGALDRLHYERDPCVQFDGERKLWVYLHRDREEEDFEDDGTSSTKKWKRPRKDSLEQLDDGAATTPYQNVREGHTGFELSSDLNFIPEPVGDDNRLDGLYNDMNLNVVNDMDHNALTEMTRMPWEALYGESKLLCQQNTNEDFDDEAFGRERPADLLSASLL